MKEGRKEGRKYITLWFREIVFQVDLILSFPTLLLPPPPPPPPPPPTVRYNMFILQTLKNNFKNNPSFLHFYIIFHHYFSKLS